MLKTEDLELIHCEQMQYRHQNDKSFIIIADRFRYVSYPHWIYLRPSTCISVMYAILPSKLTRVDKAIYCYQQCYSQTWFFFS